MIFYLLAYLGGALTVLAPCILPVLPFVFARADRPFRQTGLPVLGGMAAAFAVVASLAAVAGNWAVQANQYGRAAALSLLALMGLALLLPRIAQRLGQPFAALGAKFAGGATQWTDGKANVVLPSFLTGIATGLLWVPCAGPILGLILTGAAIEGPSLRTSLLLLAYAAGAATSLAVALLAGHRVLGALKRSQGVGEWFRKTMGVAVLAGVGAIALGLDTGLLSQLSSQGSQSLEKHLFDRLAPTPPGGHPTQPARAPLQEHPRAGLLQVQARPALVLPVEGRMPPITGAVEWLNSPPLSTESLRGKVVLVDFWTFGCINCRNALPYVREWHRKYKDQGLVVVGVHSPEFAYEKDIGNVKQALVRLGVSFPVAVDNNFTIWRAFGNRYWPAHYFVDARGNIRFHHFGEGEYEKSEQVIQQLLEEARKDARPGT